MDHYLNNEDIGFHKAQKFTLNELVFFENKNIYYLLNSDELTKRQLRAVKEYGHMLMHDYKDNKIVFYYGWLVYYAFSAKGINRYMDSLTGLPTSLVIMQMKKILEDELAPSKFNEEIQKAVSFFENNPYLKKLLFGEPFQFH